MSFLFSSQWNSIYINEHSANQLDLYIYVVKAIALSNVQKELKTLLTKFTLYICSTFQEIANEAFISLALWSPIGSDLVYVLDNDIYHMTFNNSENVVRRLTTNGEPGLVYNGVPDWVYEGKAVFLWQ